MRKRAHIGGVYTERDVVGALARIKYLPRYTFYGDIDQDYTISGVRYRVEEDGRIIPVFTLKELDDARNLSFPAHHLIISDIEGGTSMEHIYYGITNKTLDTLKESDLETLERIPVNPLSKTGINYNEGEGVVILIPKGSELKATKDNGFGEKTKFDDIESGIRIGYNGGLFTIGGNEYKVYGQIFLNSGTCYIYVD